MNTVQGLELQKRMREMEETSRNSEKLQEAFSFHGNEPSAILPINTVNMITGENRNIGNIYDTWDKDDTTVEFWQTPSKDKIVAIITSGKKPIFQVGDYETFVHDQTRRKLFDGMRMRLIDFCLLEELSEVGPWVVEKKSVQMYVYK
jgi:hypothetical protein